MSDYRFIIEVRRGDWGWQAHVRDFGTNLPVQITQVYPTKGMAQKVARGWIDRQPERPAGGAGQKSPRGESPKSSGCRSVHPAPIGGGT
jgi:hypothetical protein